METSRFFVSFFPVPIDCNAGIFIRNVVTGNHRSHSHTFLYAYLSYLLWQRTMKGHEIRMDPRGLAFTFLMVTFVTTQDCTAPEWETVSAGFVKGRTGQAGVVEHDMGNIRRVS
jgi:hypothetical protein